MGKQDLSAIETDIAETRERLAATIDELVHRASPRTIARREVNAIKGYFVDESGAPRQDNIIKVAAGLGGFVLAVVVLRKITR